MDEVPKLDQSSNSSVGELMCKYGPVPGVLSENESTHISESGKYSNRTSREMFQSRTQLVLFYLYIQH